MYLAQHVSFCVVGRHCVFIDVNANRYFCIERQRHDELVNLISSSNSVPEQTDAVSAKQTLSQLLQKGLLVAEENHGKPYEAASNPKANQQAFWRATKGKITGKRLINFTTAALRTEFELKLLSFPNFVQTHARRGTSDLQGIGELTEDVALRDDLVNSFDRMRPLHPRASVCLYDTVFLKNYLAEFGFNSTVVFGVRTDPFMAHCWLQDRQTTLNEDLFIAGRYTPILSI